MTTYTFAQLEQLWINAGGSEALAPLMAGVAEVESGGNPEAYNPSGASGLWQIEIPVNESYVPGGAANVFNAADNAKAAVALSGNTMSGIQSNWLAFEPSGAAEAIAAKNGGTVPSGAGSVPSASSTSSGSSKTSTSDSTSTSTSTAAGGPSVSDLTSLLAPLRSLLHAVATVIDYSFSMFEPGQGYRLLFGAGALILAFLSFKVISRPGGALA